MDNSSLQFVSEIGRHLAQRSRPNKDFIVKSLGVSFAFFVTFSFTNAPPAQIIQIPVISIKAANALAQIKQSPQPRTAKELQAAKKQEDALKPLANAVVCGGLLQHADKEVRLLVAMCVTELFRLMAPEPPFEDKHLRDVFKLIISSFEDLADTASPFFSKRVKVLEIMAQLKCCVIMLEIDCLDLVLQMFNIFFSIVRLSLRSTYSLSFSSFCLASLPDFWAYYLIEENLYSGMQQDEHLLISAMTSIMINILYESEEAFQQLFGVILQNLVKQKKDAILAAEKLAASVIKTCAQEDDLNLLVCGFLASCIHDRDAMGSGLKDYYYEIFSKVFQCAPQMLLSVIPTLIKELSADEVDVRIKAVNLAGKLFALEHRVAQKYHDLFVEFLKRFSDKSVDVRISALQCAKTFYLANAYDGTESREVMTASVEDRLLDSDEQITVRKSALQKLIKVYRDYCKKCYEGSMTISSHFEEIPCKIMMLCYDKDCKEFRFQNMEFVLADDLFPEDLPVEERTNHWIHMFSLFSFPHEKALDAILTQKRRFQNEMKNYLAMRKKLKEICPEEMEKKIESMFTKMAAFFPDSHKAEECLHKLNQIKDISVFKLLEKLLEEQAFTTMGQTMKDKHLAIVRYCPSMLKGLEQQFQMLLEQKSSVNDKLIEVIAKAVCNMSFNHSDIYPFLKRICLDGTRRQAKFAGSAIIGLSSEQSVLRNLYEMEHLDDGHDAISFHDTSQCSESCQLKIYGLKTLVKISLHYEGSYVKRNINGLLETLSRMLRESDHFVSRATSSCENDKAHIRLAAAKAILRLARKWDLHITPQTFRFSILIAKDPSLFVRSKFLIKTQKLLKGHKLPIRFACAFALAAPSGIGDMQYQLHYLCWISNYNFENSKVDSRVILSFVMPYFLCGHAFLGSLPSLDVHLDSLLGL
ncbi:unnamed protein product [Sphenostylis stenocarpa]|uniref:Uncharacterized protein n=1 Tax=Sphenostylis stenocarpa TaxID=92480 RepID=A0AA86VUM8_9FABA|nr:unnamed protein product [Sphenostylis stenocarpa]